MNADAEVRDSFAATLDITVAARADAAGLAARQARRLEALLRAALATPRGRALLHGRDPARCRLADLPPTGKAELMRDFDAAVADPAVTRAALAEFMRDPGRAGLPFPGRLGPCWAWESSGSSGEPGLYVHDAAAMAVYDALEASRRDSPRPWLRAFDPLFLGERIAFVGATGGHFASHVSVERLRRTLPWATQRWRSVSILQPLAAIVRELNGFAPTILATYPTAAAMLADEARAGRLTARPAEVWTGGETLGATVRREVEAAFGCALRDSYGASEFLPIAWECSEGRLHVNADWVILEAVDARGRAVPAGTPSHTTLVTNLANHLMPIIRFDIGDQIVLGAGAADGPCGPGAARTCPCPCGSALPVVEVRGRRDDTLFVAGRAARRVPLLPLALTTVLEDEAGTHDFQLQQTAPDTLRLVLGPAAACSAAAREQCRRVLARFADQQGAVPLRIETRAAAALPLGRTGKLKRVVALAARKFSRRLGG